LCGGIRCSPAVSVLVFLSALFTSPNIFAQTCDDGWRAELASAEGDVEGRRRGETDWSPATRGDIFCIGDSLRTQSYGRALVLLPDETSFRLDEDTTVTIVPPQDDSASWLDLLRGAIYIISRDPRALGILTPFANAGIEGTEFLVEVAEQEASITVFEGIVIVSNSAGEASVVSGQRVIARQSQQPVAQTVVRPRDAVQWTLYYAPVLGGALPAPDEAPAPQRANDASFYAARAGARLSVGRVDEANNDIQQALLLDSGNAEALSLQAIVAVTQNDKAEALRLADRAVAQNPASAAPLIAQSYARQASFDVSGALASLRSAVEREPSNALAWARLSELWLAVGDVDQSLDAAQQAVSLNPGIARTQTVLGFAYLTRVELAQAMNAFALAIGFDDAAPLPHLGLGLALIREGELGAGRGELEVAVMLDPGNALIRSYMGKAYYEERRGDLAESQLAIAKELDALDPTPFFYDAIRKQTSNRPGEALQDLRTSIEANENRAVYRSSLLIDEDLAARSAGLGRIYTDLGFERLAVLEGTKSIEKDPGSHSGHRLLADTYAALPRHDIARVSELFQSQLLQPLNVTPIQPQLGEANLFLLDRAGPAEISFNEFNPIFNRDGLTFQASGVRGGNDTWGENLIVSGIVDRVSYSVGQFHFETDGFRQNNDLEQDVLNAFVQYRPSPDTSLLGEIRTTERHHGDLSLRFHKQNFLPTVRTDEDNDSVRLGFRRRLSPRSQLIGSVIYQSVDAVDTDLPVLAFSLELDGYTGEFLHLFTGDRWRQTTGLRYMTRDSHEVLSIQDQIPFPPFSIEFTLEEEVTTDNVSVYSYSSFDVTERLTISGGASADKLDVLGLDHDHVNPKIGVTWEPSERTTVRAAAFRTVQFPAYSRQDIQPRLEPTQVAGFNQRYFGSVGEEAENTAVSINHVLTENVFLGAELVNRSLEVPFIVDIPGVGISTLIEDVDEQLGRAYAYWVPRTEFAVSVEYQYDRFKNANEDFVPEGFAELTTQRIPIQFVYFDPSGFRGKLTATFVDQDGVFRQQAPPFMNFSDEDEFWVLDASVGYRLPGRRGMLSLDVKNVLDEEFNFQDVDPQNPRIVPERLVLFRFTVNFSND
jgi:tetratricopeptide (TPR) repeat protein